jgi:uncharacterized protein (TIGR03066 family)
MKTLFALAACLVLSLPVRGQDPTKVGKIVGKWELTKSEEIPPGVIAEFTKDGKLSVTLTVKGPDGKGMSFKLEGTYKVEGNTLTVAMKGPDGKEKTDKDTIKELTDKKLVLEDDKGKVTKFKKK